MSALAVVYVGGCVVVLWAMCKWAGKAADRVECACCEALADFVEDTDVALDIVADAAADFAAWEQQFRTVQP